MKLSYHDTWAFCSCKIIDATDNKCKHQVAHHLLHTLTANLTLYLHTYSLGDGWIEIFDDNTNRYRYSDPMAASIVPHQITKWVIALDLSCCLEAHLERLWVCILAKHQHHRFDQHINASRGLNKCFIHCISLAHIGDSPWYRFRWLEIGDGDWWEIQVKQRFLGCYTATVCIWPKHATEQLLVIWSINIVYKSRITCLSRIDKSSSIIKRICNLIWGCIS